jgi:hypothetical protein
MRARRHARECAVSLRLSLAPTRRFHSLRSASLTWGQDGTEPEVEGVVVVRVVVVAGCRPAIERDVDPIAAPSHTAGA